MSFIQPCFIRKNTTELRKKLEEMGYKRDYPDYTSHCKTIFAYQYPIKGFDTPSYTIADSFDLPYADGSALRGKFIDCGTNEDLFLALAALRDDTDKNQWFASNYFDKHGNPDEWRFCTEDDYKDFFGDCPYIRNYDDYHKATVSEIIEYFKEKPFLNNGNFFSVSTFDLDEIKPIFDNLFGRHDTPISQKIEDDIRKINK